MKLVSQAEFARIAGVTRRSVSYGCKQGELRKAGVNGQVDLDHPDALAYLKKHGRRPPRGPRPQPFPLQDDQDTRPSADENPADHNAPEPRYIRATVIGGEGPNGIEDIERFADMTLRQIVTRFGSMTAHRDWLDMRKKQVDIHEKELKNRETEGELIPREAVRVHVFGTLEELHKRLLHDVPKNLVRTIYGMAKSGTPVEEAEKDAREKIGALLRPVKDKAARALRKRQGDGDSEP